MQCSWGFGVGLAVFSVETASDVAMGVYLIDDRIRVASSGGCEDVKLSMAGELLEERIQMGSLVDLVEGTLGCFQLGDAEKGVA